MDASEESETLKKISKNKIIKRRFKRTKSVYSSGKYCFYAFILIYFPCVAVIAAIKKEANWGWAIFTMVYTTALAWLVAFATYQIGSLFV
jgi:ferrous iron transport protein B